MPAVDATIVTCPPREVNQDQLREEIAVAVDRPAPYVDVYEDRIEVVGDVAGVEDEVIEAVAAHVPTAPPPTLAEKLDEALDRIASLEAALGNS